MKLLNQSIKYLSVSILLIIGLWAVIFYFNMLNEIKDSVDEGLKNYKRHIIAGARTDTAILSHDNFNKGLFTIREIGLSKAMSMRDQFADTLLSIQDEEEKDQDMEPFRILTTVFENNGHYYELRIVNSMVEEDDLIENMFWIVVWLYVVLIISILLINNLVLKHLWRPFYGFLQQLKGYRLGSSQKLPELKTKTKEFADLQKAVNTLLSHSLAVYEQQKQFIGNASHELQTPLAIVMNRLELLLENTNLEKERAEKIAEVMAIVQRLVRLNKSLLLLAKIENHQFLDNKEVSINKIVHQSIADLTAMADHTGVKFTVEETAECTVEMDASLAGILVANLIRNAVFHNVPDGTVSVVISDNTFCISNTGTHEPLQADKVFNRFYKSDMGPKRTGLGLSIAKAICNLYGFDISYLFEKGKHAFVLQLGED